MTVRFQVGNHGFVMKNLDPTTNAAFIDLHQHLVGRQPLNEAAYSAAVGTFFDQNRNLPARHDDFFENFSTIWTVFVNQGRHREAEDMWQVRAVQPALEWERTNPGSFIHKGTPYYFWGETCILRGDVDRGFTLMHKALEEDQRTHNTNLPQTPSMAFATLDDSHMNQQFREWTVEQADFLRHMLTAYQAEFGSPLDLVSLRNRFLSHPPSTETIFLFAHAVARLRNLDVAPDYLFQTPFAGQLEANLLFDLSLVVDVAIRNRNPNAGTFYNQALHLSQVAHLGLTTVQLQELAGLYNSQIDQTLSSILRGTFRFRDGTQITNTGATALALTYGLRNHSAHNVAPVPTISQEFQALRQALFNVLFLCVDTLY
jgi:hypothetical protein